MKKNLALLALIAGSLLANSQFNIRRMTRNDVPLGKGQCDIRLQIDGEAEVAVTGDRVSIRTISGRDGRDDGSECNEPLPNRDMRSFNFEVKDSRGEIALLDQPNGRNGYRAIVRIRDSQGGEGRYHFRLTWDMTGGGTMGGRRRAVSAATVRAMAMGDRLAAATGRADPSTWLRRWMFAGSRSGTGSRMTIATTGSIFAQFGQTTVRGGTTTSWEKRSGAAETIGVILRSSAGSISARAGCGRST